MTLSRTKLVFADDTMPGSNGSIFLNLLVTLNTQPLHAGKV
ncbi:hypothetical protein [Desulfobacula sp.]|nr:hypothetical protein [Desulfobacula sp.]